MGAKSTKKKVVPSENSDADLRNEYRDLKKKWKRAKRSGKKSQAQRLKKQMSVLRRKFDSDVKKKKKKKKRRNKEGHFETSSTTRVEDTKQEENVLEEEKVTIKSPSKSLELLDSLEFEKSNKERFSESNTKESRQIRFNVDDNNDSKTNKPFEVLLQGANEKLLNAKTMPLHRFENGSSSLKCFRIGLEDDIARDLTKCQELLRNVFPVIDQTRELVAIEIPFPMSDFISMKNNVVVYSSPETKLNGVHEGDLLLMIEGTLVVDKSDIEVLQLADRLLKEEDFGEEDDEEEEEQRKKLFSLIFLS